MPGYHLFETASGLPTAKDFDGRPFDRLGFLDFLRELAGNEPSVPRLWVVSVFGLEDALFAAGADAEWMTHDIHRRLRSVASILESRAVDVYVEFRGRLQRGDDLWSEYRATRIPVGNIFGSPPPQQDSKGRRIYFANFNLTHGG